MKDITICTVILLVFISFMWTTLWLNFDRIEEKLDKQNKLLKLIANGLYGGTIPED